MRAYLCSDAIFGAPKTPDFIVRESNPSPSSGHCTKQPIFSHKYFRRLLFFLYWVLFVDNRYFPNGNRVGFCACSEVPPSQWRRIVPRWDVHGGEKASNDSNCESQRLIRGTSERRLLGFEELQTASSPKCFSISISVPVKNALDLTRDLTMVVDHHIQHLLLRGEVRKCF